jgi:hypothetical protein
MNMEVLPEGLSIQSASRPDYRSTIDDKMLNLEFPQARAGLGAVLSRHNTINLD